MSIAFDSPPARPSRSEIEPVALDLIRSRGSEVLGIARRYASTPDDAEDAYQRSLEILLTKAPTTREDQLLPWLKTVVRHECYALRKKRERDIPVEHEELDAFTSGDSHAADERAERYDRLRVGAEALGRLKPQETRALLLKAEGMSYQEIAAQTGWSYTKVNRCLVEGRRAFYARVRGIESGEECERLDPLLSALADREATAEQLAALRPHLRGCPSCRARLRDYREAPALVRDLGGSIVAAGVFGLFAGRVWSTVRSLFETAAVQKATVVAASTAVVAGGGAATVQMVEPPAERPAVHRAAAQPSRPAGTAPVTVPAVRATVTARTGRQRRRKAKPPAARSSSSTASSPSATQTTPASKPASPVQSNPPPRASATSPPAAQRAPQPVPAPADSGGEFGP